jgi:predicted nucleic acid-binding protein
MILFCDTSAVVKLYVVEPSSADMKRLVQEAEVVAVCRIAWAEAHAALSRRAREVPVDAPAISAAKRAFGEDWPRYLVMEVTQPLVERAARYADTFALRGYDSVQLAAAHETAMLAEAPVSFACFDERLNKAAIVLGMTAPFIEGP